MPDSPSTDPSSPPIARRRRLLTGLVISTVLVTLLGLGAARWVRSPQQALADQAAPAPTVLTAPVEKRILRDTVVLRGVVGAARTYKITPSTPTDVDKAVVSGLRVGKGESVHAGQVLVEVSGRPLISLKGKVPAYRDLRPGDDGRDVVQLQKALRALGLSTGDDHRGVLGSGTKAAIGRLYRRVGYAAPIEGDPAALSAARTQQRQAERTLVEARDTLRQAEASSGSVTEAERLVEYAREDLADAVIARQQVERLSGPKLPMSEAAFLPTFPARVESLTAKAGREVTEPLITVSSGALVVRGRVNAGQRSLLRTGMPVRLDSEVQGTSATGVLSKIGAPSTDSGGTRGHPVTVTADRAAFPRALAGEDVRLTVETAATEAEVLVVPFSAVIAGADGSTSVLRAERDHQTRVRVTPGVSGDGYLEVTPVAGGLSPGDQVVVGVGR